MVHLNHQHVPRHLDVQIGSFIYLFYFLVSILKVRLDHYQYASGDNVIIIALILIPAQKILTLMIF